MARTKPRDTFEAKGSNGYTLQVHDIDDENLTAVVVGTATGKRHANVSMEWSDAEALLHWLADKIGYTL